MGRPVHKLTALCAALLLASGCFGPFRLTRRLYAWNARVGDKWEQEVVFIVLKWVPVYGLVLTADALFFNSVEFWTGKNLVDEAAAGGADRAVFSRADREGTRAMLVQLYRNGAAAEAMTITQRAGEPITAVDERGRTLFTAQTLEDGAITVHDRSGRQVAAYSARDVEQALHVAHQDLR